MTQGFILKKKVVTSKKWRKLPDDFSRLTYLLLVACVDSWGMLPADGLSLKYHLGKYDNHTPEDYEKALSVLVDVGLVKTWEHQDDPWLYVVGHDEEQRLYKRKGSPEVPRPDQVVGRLRPGYDQVTTKSQPGCDQVTTSPSYDLDLDLDLETDSACARSKPRAKNKPKPVCNDNTSPHKSHKQPRSLIPQSKRRDLDPEILEVTSYHAKLWDLGAPQDPGGDDRRRIEQAIEQYGLEACRFAIKGQRDRCRKEGTTEWQAIKWAFPGEMNHGRRDTRKLSTGEFTAYVERGRPKHKPIETTCHEEKTTPKTPEEQQAQVQKLIASVFKEVENEEK